MAKKLKETPLRPPSSTSTSSSYASSSSSSGEDSPPPVVSPVKKPIAVSSVAPLGKHTEHSSESIDRKEEEDEKNESSETKEGSSSEESFDDAKTAVFKSNPQLQLRESQKANDRKALNSSPSSNSRSEEEEGSDEVGSSSESEQQQQQQQPPPLDLVGNTGRNKAAALISVSNMTAPPRSSSRNVADPSLKPLNSKPMDNAAQPDDQKPISRKRLATNSGPIAEKKRRTSDALRAEGGQVKKETSRRIWSKVDELSLLQCILDYKEKHHAIPCTQMQLDSLLKPLNDSLSTTVTINQISVKIRRLKEKYINTSKSIKCTKNQTFANAHDAVAFDKSRKIWGSAMDDFSFLEEKIKPEIMKNFKKTKGKEKDFAEEYPFLCWHAKMEHPKKALIFENHIPIAEAKELEGSCKKLEITEIQLHMQKIKLLPSALKLIEDVLAT